MNHNKPRHIYLKQICTKMFPVIAIAKYFFAYPTFLKDYCHFFPGDSRYNFLVRIFVMFLNNIRMILLLLMLMCMTLYITYPTKALTHCVNMVAQCNVLYHTFASVQDCRWEI